MWRYRKGILHIIKFQFWLANKGVGSVPLFPASLPSKPTHADFHELNTFCPPVGSTLTEPQSPSAVSTLSDGTKSPDAIVGAVFLP